MNFFLSGDSSINIPVLEALNPVSIGDVLVITEMIDNYVLGTLIESTTRVTTLANGELFMRGKNLYTNFGSHSIQLREVGNLLRTIVSLNSNVTDIKIGQSSGIVRVLDEIDSRISLSTVTFFL